MEEKITSKQKYMKPIDFHVWITLPDLSIIDMTLDASILESLEKDSSQCEIIMWRDDNKNGYIYEPLFIHDNLDLLID